MSEKTGYKPTSGMQSAARRAIKLKEAGKAKGAGTMVGWTRAGQLVRGESLSLSTVKRMYSFFSRHEVDKKGKDFDNAENPSNGKIMWLAWGGDAGFSWSRKIVNREKNMKKSVEITEVIEEIKDMLDDAVNPFTKSVEIEIELEEDVEKKKDKFKDVITPRKGEPSNKELYAKIISEAKAKFDVYPSAYANGWVVQEYKRRGGKYNVKKSEGIEAGFDESEIEDNYEGLVEKAEDMTTTADCKCAGCMECKAAGGCDMKMCKMHKKMEKAYQDCGCETCKAMDVSCENCPDCTSKSYHSDNEDEDKWNNMEKACWSGYRQQGMKDKGGRQVPNCVPIKKSLFGTEGPQTIVPRNK